MEDYLRLQQKIPGQDQQQRFYDCTICNIRKMPYSSENINNHFQSKAHIHMKMFYDNYLWPSNEEDCENSTYVYKFLDFKGTIMCELCKKIVLDGSALLKHQHQPEHLRILIEQRLQDKVPVIYACETCDVALIGHNAYFQHNSTADHLSKVTAQKHDGFVAHSDQDKNSETTFAKSPTGLPSQWELTSSTKKQWTTSSVNRQSPKELQNSSQLLVVNSSSSTIRKSNSETKNISSQPTLNLVDPFTREILNNLLSILNHLSENIETTDLLIAGLLKSETDFSGNDTAANLRQILLRKIAQESKSRHQTRQIVELIAKKHIENLLEEPNGSADNLLEANKIGEIEKHRSKSRSKTRKKSRSRSRSRNRKRSRSRSRTRKRSRSRMGNRSRSRTRKRTRSRSQSRKRHRSRSTSPPKNALKPSKLATVEIYSEIIAAAREDKDVDPKLKLRLKKKTSVENIVSGKIDNAEANIATSDSNKVDDILSSSTISQNPPKKGSTFIAPSTKPSIPLPQEKIQDEIVILSDRDDRSPDVPELEDITVITIADDAEPAKDNARPNGNLEISGEFAEISSPIQLEKKMLDILNSAIAVEKLAKPIEDQKSTNLHQILLEKKETMLQMLKKLNSGKSEDTDKVSAPQSAIPSETSKLSDETKNQNPLDTFDEFAKVNSLLDKKEYLTKLHETGYSEKQVTAAPLSSSSTETSPPPPPPPPISKDIDKASLVEKIEIFFGKQIHDTFCDLLHQFQREYRSKCSRFKIWNEFNIPIRDTYRDKLLKFIGNKLTKIQTQALLVMFDMKLDLHIRQSIPMLPPEDMPPAPLPGEVVFPLKLPSGEIWPFEPPRWFYLMHYFVNQTYDRMSNAVSSDVEPVPVVLSTESQMNE